MPSCTPGPTRCHPPSHPGPVRYTHFCQSAALLHGIRNYVYDLELQFNNSLLIPINSQPGWQRPGPPASPCRGAYAPALYRYPGDAGYLQLTWMLYLTWIIRIITLSHDCNPIGQRCGLTLGLLWDHPLLVGWYQSRPDELLVDAGAWILPHPCLMTLKSR